MNSLMTDEQGERMKCLAKAMQIIDSLFPTYQLEHQSYKEANTLS